MPACDIYTRNALSFRCTWMILHISRMRRNVNRKDYHDRKSVSATAAPDDFLETTTPSASRGDEDYLLAYIRSIIQGKQKSIANVHCGFPTRCYKQGWTVQSSDDIVKHDYPPCRHVYTTSSSHVKSNRADMSLSANNDAKSDSRLCLHVDDALNDEATTVLVRTANTDVVVILVGIFHDLAQHHQGMQLWVGRLWHRQALPLLPHQLNLTRTWVG